MHLAPSRWLLPCILLALTLSSGCKKAPDPIIESLYDRLEAAIDVMDDHKGDQAAAIAALEALYQSRSNDIVAYRSKLKEVEAAFDEKQKEAHQKRLTELKTEIENHARGYETPMRLLQIIAQLY